MAIRAFAKIRILKSTFSTQYLLCVALIFLLFFTLSYYVLDPDFGWHLTTGRYYIQNWIPKNDIFTYTAQNFPWISHEWLNDYLIAKFYNFGGYGSVAAIFALIWTSALVIASRKYNSLVLIFSAFAVLTFSGIRPIAWTVLFIAILERIMGSKNKRLSYFLPIIFILWANLHGSFVLGLLFLGLWQVFSKNKLPWIPTLLCLPAVLINPYGPWIFEEIIRTTLDSKLRFRISEWQMIVLPILSATYMVIFVAFHIVFAKKPFKKVLSYPGMMLALSISSIRHFPVFVVVSLRHLESYLDEFTSKINLKKLSKTRVLIVCLIALTPMIVVLYHGIGLIRSIQGSKSAYPVNAVAYLNQVGCKGNLFNSYNYGGYIIWQLPQYKTYIDGRMPSWKLQGTDYFENYINVFAKDEFRHSEFEKHNIKCVLLSTADSGYSKGRAVPLNDQLLKEGWVRIDQASTSNYSLFVQR